MVRLIKRWVFPGFACLFAAVGILVHPASGASVTLAWDANTESDLGGYVLYYGTNSGSYTDAVRLGRVTTNTVGGLVEGRTYFFAVTATNTAGLESDPSNELIYTAPNGDLPTVLITIPTSNSSHNTNGGTISLGGVASDNQAVTQVTWANNRGGSGAANGTTNWGVAGITLQQGTNILTVTARDASGNVATDTLTVSYTPPDVTPPALTISAPTGAATLVATSSPMNLAGSASDNLQVVQVTWTNNRGGSGTATGTANWSVNGVILQAGTNVITVTARDAAGNSGADILTVAYSPPDSTAPTVTITAPTAAPTLSVSNNSLSLTGTATDNVQVSLVTWTNNRGGSGTASGTTNWTVSGISLLTGTNVLTIVCRDSFGNTAADAISVVCLPPPPPSNQPPVVAGFFAQHKMKKNSRLTLPFVATDAETPSSNLVLTVTSSNGRLMPVTQAFLAGAGTNRTLTLQPTRRRIGKSVITVSVSDGMSTQRQAFTLVVTDRTLNKTPVIYYPPTLAAFNEEPLSIPGLRVTDVDAQGANVTLVLASGHGAIHVATNVANGLTANEITSNGSAVVIITAPLWLLNPTLSVSNSVVYRPNPGFIGTDVVYLTVTDNGNTGTGGAKTARRAIQILVQPSPMPAATASSQTSPWGDAFEDPDHDGHNNFLEFALGLNPNQREPGLTGVNSCILHTNGHAHLSITFRRRKSDPRIVYLPEVSADGHNWQSDPSAVGLVGAEPVDDEIEIAASQDFTPLLPFHGRFMRLRVIAGEIEAASEIFVGTATTFLAGQPTMFGLPMARPAVYVGRVSESSGHAIVDEEANWIEGEFNGINGRFYAEFDSGLIGDIVATDPSNNRLVFSGALPAWLQAGESYRVRRHHTLQDTVASYASDFDKIVLFDPIIQQSAEYTYRVGEVFAGWYSQAGEPASDTVIYPAEGAAIGVSTDQVLLSTGVVNQGPAVAVVLPGQNLLCVMRAVRPVTLNDLNLFTGDYATGLAAGNDSHAADTVTLLKADGSSATYFFCDLPGAFGWRDLAYDPAGDVALAPGSAFVLHRKSPRGQFYWSSPRD